MDTRYWREVSELQCNLRRLELRVSQLVAACAPGDEVTVEQEIVVDNVHGPMTSMTPGVVSGRRLTVATDTVSPMRSAHEYMGTERGTEFHELANRVEQFCVDIIGQHMDPLRNRVREVERNVRVLNSELDPIRRQVLFRTP